MKKTALFLVFLGVMLAFSISAHAASFQARVIPIRDKIVVDEVAEFEIEIQNYLGTNEEFTIKKAGYPFWDMYTKPLQSPITLAVPAQSTANISIFVDPLYITSVDTYTLETGVVLERLKEEQKVPVTIGIKSTDPLIQGYVPTVLATVSISPEKIDPRNDAAIIVALSNQNIINYSNLTLKIESPILAEEMYFSLGPKEDKTIEIKVELDDDSPPQKENLVIAIFKDDRIIVSPIVKEFEIAEYSTTEELPKEQSFLKIKRTFRIFSNNPDYSGAMKVETTPLKNLFLSTTPRAELEKEGKTHNLVWNVELGPDKTMTIFVNENYRPLVVIIILAAAAIVMYFLFRSPLVARKSIANIGMSEGGISEAKIVVRIKNRSSKPIANIEVMDHAPHIAHVEKELSIGSMQPHAILQHPKRGILIKWTIEHLDPGDERVLSYKMRSRLPILGELSLPAATARAKIGNKVVISNSNRVSVGA